MLEIESEVLIPTGVLVSIICWPLLSSFFIFIFVFIFVSFPQG